MDSENWIDRKVIRSSLNMVRSQVCPDTLSKSCLSRSKTKPLAQASTRAPSLERQALASALIVGSTYGGKPAGLTSPHTPLSMMYQMFERCVEEDIRPCEISLSVEASNALNAYSKALDRLPSWTAFRTASGYIGRGPPLVRRGDKVCIFEDARTPFTIRKATTPRFAPATSTIW